MAWREQKLPVSGLSLSGYSKAADKTAFYLKEYKWFLDAGTVESQTPKRVFITHCHQDHTMHVPLMLTHRWDVDIYCPSSTAPFLNNYLIAATELNENAKIEADRKHGCKYTIHPVGKGDKIDLQNEKYVVKVVECNHSVPTVGYCFSELRNKIKDEYKDLPGKEIGELKKKGTQVTNETEIPAFVFLGDGTPKVFQDHPEILTYPVVIAECTFLEDSHKELADKKKHSCWVDLKGTVLKNPKVVFILIHFSMRYKDEEIISFFKSQKTEGGQPLENIIPWLK